MSVEVRPVGVQCNIACQYCYQNVLRDAEWGSGGETDLPAIKDALAEHDESFHLFGGEPLLMDVDQLEELFFWGFERFGENGIQTNGVLLTDRHIEMFRRYRVQVGLSVDGPDSLNDARWAGTLERTRRATAASIDAIERLCRAQQPPGLMIQLTRCNGVGDALERLCAWLAEMNKLGVLRARIHILELDDPEIRARYGLTVSENIAAFTRMERLGRELPTLNLDCNADKREMLMMEDGDVACVWRGCDPLFTEAVMGVGSQGEDHKCGLTDKEGVNFERGTEPRYERYLALYATPQEYGGCQGCRFFAACKGQCPGTGIDGDWRNRSENCGVFKILFQRAEESLMAEGRVPLSMHPARPRVEAELVEAWTAGRNPELAEIRQSLRLDLGPPITHPSRRDG